MHKSYDNHLSCPAFISPEFILSLSQKQGALCISLAFDSFIDQIFNVYMYYMYTHM